MYFISYKPKIIFSGPICNFLMTGLRFEVMPNWASHTHLAGQNREKTRQKADHNGYLTAMLCHMFSTMTPPKDIILTKTFFSSKYKYF